MSETIKLPFWATLLTLCGVLILCALGTWQLQRLAWKNDIIAQLETAYSNPVTPLISADITNDFAYGTITGKAITEKAFLLGHAIKDETQGKFLILPLETKDTTWLVNLGWSSNEDALKDNSIHRHKNQTIAITGLARKPNWNSFTPQNNPDTDTWYRYDINQIAQAKDIENPAPFILYAAKTSKNFSKNIGNHEQWQPKSNHAQYAFFWFALASALIVVYILRFLMAKKTEH